MEEKIVCFSRSILSKYPNRSGVLRVRDNEDVWDLILSNLQFMPRTIVEQNYDYKQLVVYVLTKAGELYLTYKRTRKTEEERLREKHSLGIGGHVNLSDRSQIELFRTNHEKGMSFILQGVWREIREEIDIESRTLGEPELIYFINDDSDRVGWKHFGVVWLLRIEEPNVSRKGKGIGELKFQDLNYLRANKRKFERWSQLLIDHFLRGEG